MQSFSLVTLLLGVIGVTVLSRSSSSSSCDAFAPRLGPTSPPKLSPAAAVSSSSASSLAAAVRVNDDVRAAAVTTTLVTLGLLFAVATTATPACATVPPSSISSISSSLVLAGGEIKESDIADFSLPSYQDASRAATNSNLKGDTSLLDATFAKQFADLDVGSSKAATTTDISAEDAKAAKDAAKDAAKAAQKAARAAQQAAAEQALSK